MTKFKILTLTILILIKTNMLNSKCSYIKAQNRPINIAHRGLCSILPQNTMQAFETALFLGADFIELDVVLTLQKEVLVMHDPFLSRITDIQRFEQFQQRKKKRIYEDEQRDDWWIDEFTLKQLKGLKIKQMRGKNRTDIFDQKYTFSTLSQVIQRVIKFNQLHKGNRNPDKRLGGILIQAKNQQFHRKQSNIQIGQKILQILNKYEIDSIQKAQKKCPIYLQSFDYDTIKYWSKNTQLPRSYLLQKLQTNDLKDIVKYANGVGLKDDIVWNYQNNLPKPILYQTKQAGLSVHVWTFHDDIPFFGVSNPIDMYLIAHLELKLDGIITEFSDVLAPISHLMKYNRFQIQRQRLWHHTQNQLIIHQDQQISSPITTLLNNQ